MTPDLLISRSAEISPCGLYRWRLARRWGDGPVVCFIMLNPSYGDREIDDRTIAELMRRAREWGFGALVIANLCPLRAVSPRATLPWFAGDAPAWAVSENRQEIDRAIWESEMLVVAWGAFPPAAEAARALLAELRGRGIVPHHLGLTAGGFPKHPLARGRHRIHREQKPLRWAA